MLIKKGIFSVLILSFICFQSNFVLAQLCNCTEYLYLNEPEGSTNPGIHKFELNENYNPATDPAASVIVQEIGNPWFSNAAANESLINPHGVGVDLNGNLYIAEDNNAGAGGIRKFKCDGTLLDINTYYIPNTAGFSFGSEGNTIYVNRNQFDGIEADNVIEAYDLCTGSLTGFYCLNGLGVRADWGLYLEDDSTMLVTNDFLAAGDADNVPNNLFMFNINTATLNAPAEVNPVCIEPFISQGTTTPAIGSNDFARDRVFGVVADSDGNIFVVERTVTGDLDFPAGATDGSARILKYDSNGVLVTVTPYDTNDTDGLGGYFEAIGIYYSQSLDLLFVSTASPEDDCVALFDTDLNYLGPAVPSPGTGTQGKAIFITEECCPATTPAVENVTLCNPTLGEQIFLLDLIGCTVCEGNWTININQNEFNYDACNNSITIDDLNECGSFTLTSNGTATLSQCPAFEITLNVCTQTTPNCINEFGEFIIEKRRP